MNMFCYILGSEIIGKPYIMEICLCLCLLTLFGWLCWYGALHSKNMWHMFAAAVCGCFAFLSLFSALFLSIKALELPESEEVHFEKVEFENHEYLIYKHHEVIHNPNCPCRNKFTHLKECQK